MEENLIYSTIDLLASEYGWSIEYIETLSMEEIRELRKVIIERKREEYQLQCYIVNCAFAGKNPKFVEASNEKLDGDTEEEQLFRLMKKLGGKVVKV